MKTWLFFHNQDLDGHCSGAILRYYHETILHLINGIDFKMIPMDYGIPFDDNLIKDGDTVIMGDITLSPPSRMIELNKRVNLFVYDHHKSIEPILNDNNIMGLYGDDNIAGCELCYINFISASIVPEWVRLLSIWDTWNDSNKYYWDKMVKPFQMGIRTFDTNPETDNGMSFWNWWLTLQNNKNETPTMNLLFKDRRVKDIIDIGNKIIKYQNKMNEELMNRSYDMKWEGLNWIVVNGFKGSPQFDSKWDNIKYDAMMSFYYNGDKSEWGISLYTTKKDIDLSIIASKWGGGGHPQACGFRINNINDIIDNKGDNIK